MKRRNKNMNKDSVSKVITYIKSTGRLTHNRKHLVDLLDVNDRQVREAFYKQRDLGVTVIAYPKNCMTIVTEHNYNLYRDKAIDRIIQDKKIALKKLSRINKQLKTLPEKDQIKIDKEVLGYVE